MRGPPDDVSRDRDRGGGDRVRDRSGREALERPAGEGRFDAAIVAQHHRVDAEAAEGREDLLGLDEPHPTAPSVGAQPLEVHREAAACALLVVLARAEHPGERVAGAEAEQAEARERHAATPRLLDDRGHDDGERAVAAARQDGPVAAVDERARDSLAVLDAAGDEEVAAVQDLIERLDDLGGDALGVAVDDDRDPRGSSGAFVFAASRIRGRLG